MSQPLGLFYDKVKLYVFPFLGLGPSSNRALYISAQAYLLALSKPKQVIHAQLVLVKYGLIMNGK